MKKLQLACLSPLYAKSNTLIPIILKKMAVHSDLTINVDYSFCYLKISMQVHDLLTEMFLLYHDFSLSFLQN